MLLMVTKLGRGELRKCLKGRDGTSGSVKKRIWGVPGCFPIALAAYHVLTSIPGNGPWKRAGFTCFIVWHTFLTNSHSWKQTAVSSLSVRSTRCWEKRIPGGMEPGKTGSRGSCPYRACELRCPLRRSWGTRITTLLVRLFCLHSLQHSGLY